MAELIWAQVTHFKLQIHLGCFFYCLRTLGDPPATRRRPPDGPPTDPRRSTIWCNMSPLSPNLAPQDLRMPKRAQTRTPQLSTTTGLAVGATGMLWSTTPPTQPYTGAVGVVAGTDPAVANIGCRPLPQRSQCPEMDRGAHLLTSTTTISIKGAMAKLHKLWGSVCKCMLATYTVYVAHKVTTVLFFSTPVTPLGATGWMS